MKCRGLEMSKPFCIGEKEVGRLYNVTIHERTMRTARRRGENDRGDQIFFFALRSGELVGVRLSHWVAQQALAGNDQAICWVAETVEEFYADRA